MSRLPRLALHLEGQAMESEHRRQVGPINADDPRVHDARRRLSWVVLRALMWLDEHERRHGAPAQLSEKLPPKNLRGEEEPPPEKAREADPGRARPGSASTTSSSTTTTRSRHSDGA